jgi:hypothetical protein
MPTTVLASRYNTLRDQINLVLGESNPATPTFGYGQLFSTNSVLGSRAANDLANADKITAQNYEDLYIDLVRCRSHQIGAANVVVDEFVVGDYNSNLLDTDKIEEAYIINLETLASQIAADKFEVFSGNLELINIPSASSNRPNTEAAWSTEISHIFTISWPTDLDRRHFFNSGSEIRLSADVEYTGSQSKTVDWQTILNEMGSTSFKANETINNASIGTGSNIGNYNLTTSYRLIYSRTGGNVYARNRYNIYAREYTTGDSTSAIQFKVEFIDGRPNDLTYGIDEVVFGAFNSNVQISKPNSQVAINETPYDAVIIDLEPIGTLIRPLS